MKVHVFVATTQGPVAVQRIVEEDEDVQSVVCVDGGINPLPISQNYHDFVKKGTGLLHKDFGSPAFRVDVSARIDQGTSWQLPLYLAHYFFHKGLLGDGEVQQGDVLILATGAVKADRSVSPVEAIPTKFECSKDLFLANKDRSEIIALLSEENFKSNHEFISQWLKQHHLDIDVFSANSLEQMINKVSSESIAFAMPPSNDKVSKAESVHSKSKYLVWGLAALFFLSIAMFIFQQRFSVSDGNNDITSTPVPAEKEPKEAGKPVSEVTETSSASLKVKLDTRSPACEDQELVEESLIPSGGVFKAQPVDQICEIVFVTNNADSLVLSLTAYGQSIPTTKSAGGWVIQPPQKDGRNRTYFILEISNRDSLQQIDRQALKKALYDHSKLDIKTVQEIMNRLGWFGTVYQHGFKGVSS